MRMPKGYVRAFSVTGSVLLGVALIGGTAGAETGGVPGALVQAPACDYVPPDVRTTQSPIDDRYASDAELRALLGDPAGDEVADGDVSYRDYVGPPEGPGRLYYLNTAEGEGIGVHEVHGQIRERYEGAGGHGVLNVPVTDECATAGAGGKYNHFGTTADNAEQSIYWRPDTGALLVDDFGPAADVPGVHDHWEAAGYEAGTYGWPTTDTTQTGDGYGRYNHFTGDDGWGASIYWSPDSGVFGVKGLIREHWIALGAETSYLGYPVSDEFDTPDGKRSDFEGGCVTWNSATGEVTDSADCAAG